MAKKTKNKFVNPEYCKNDFLALDHVKGFVNYICNLEMSKTLNHVFKIKPGSWVKHLKADKNERFNQSESKLKINCLAEALHDYFWLTDDENDIGSLGSFEANQRILRELSSNLQLAIREKNLSDVFLTSIKILDWGGVYRGSVKWVIEEYERGTLETSISNAVSILDGDSWTNDNSFVQSNLRMDSGLTKIYSLASEKSVIYDDRVGAAIGFLIRGYIQQNPSNAIFEEWKPRRDLTIVPRELYLMVGREGRRNPSENDQKIIFQKHGQCEMDSHAYSNLLANWIVEAVRKNFRENGLIWSSREVEAALFILGYSVSSEDANEYEILG